MVYLTGRLCSIGLSFGGSGFLIIYQLGAAKCLLENGPSLMKEVKYFAGTSGGSLVAALVGIAPGKIKDVLDDFYEISETLRKKPLRTFTPYYCLTDEVKKVLLKVLPSNAYYLANNRIFISVTSLSHRKNYLLSDFTRNADLVESLICSCFIPVYDGFTIPTCRNMKCIDGSFTDNLPRFPKGRTIVVTPFSGERDIAPKTTLPGFARSIFIKNQKITISKANIIRLIHSLFPPPLQKLQEYYETGYNDAQTFLKKEGWYTSNDKGNKIIS